MKFNSVQDAFNYYRNFTIEEIEKRAAQIKGTVTTDPEADITAINMEIEGLKQAKENLEDKQNRPEVDKRSLFNPITGANFEQPAIPKGEDIFASAEYRSAFYKNLLGQNLEPNEAKTYKRAMELMDAEKRADAFNTTTNSAAVLPTITLNEIIRKVDDMGGIIHEARAFTVPANLKVPVGTPLNRASRHTEGEEVESKKATLTSVEFRALELLEVLSMSVGVKRMSVDAFESYLIEELEKSVFEAIAYELVNGTGTGEGYGLESIDWTKNANLIEYNKTKGLAYADFPNAMAKLKRGYNKGAKWAMNTATLYGSVYNLVDGNDRPLFVPDPRTNEVGHILGKEVVIDDHIADGEIYFGNLKYLGWNLVDGVMVEASRESSFRRGLVDYRALAISDSQVLAQEAFVKLAEAKS